MVQQRAHEESRASMYYRSHEIHKAPAILE